MSMFHRQLRRAVFVQLGLPGLGAPAYSSPPTNLDPPYVLIGAISAETPETKGASSAFYTFAIECWVQSRSPADLDTLSDAAGKRIDAGLTDAQATFSQPILQSEADTYDPAAPGGPTLGRVQTFRTLAQPIF